MNDTNIILGAGPAGIFCSHELNKLGQASIILELTDKVGGLAATYSLGQSSFEIGPHIFHTDDQYILDIVKQTLGDDLLEVEWNVQQLLDGQLLKFPNQILDMTKKLGTAKMVKMILSFLKYRTIKETDFKSFIYKKIGKELAEFNVINYTEKMWGIPLENLETAWIKPRMDRLSISKIIKDTFSKKSRTFYYPRYGAGTLYEKLSEVLEIQREESPIRIEHKDCKIIRVHSNKSSYNCSNVYSSIPLKSLLKVLHPLPPKTVFDAASQLVHRSQVYVVLKLKKCNLIDAQWIYFPKKDIPFCRIHCPENFSQEMNTQDGSTLVFEYFCFEQDQIWSEKDNIIIQSSIKAFQNTKIVQKLEVVESLVMRKKYAYPLMSKVQHKAFKSIETYLNKFSNLYLIGRHGLHTYDNQDEAGRTGIDAAHRAFSSIKVVDN